MSAVDQAVKAIRFLSVDGVEAAQSGHPGTPMALAGITAEIFLRHLRYDPADPAWPNRDRFVLSCGHASMLLYSTLHLAGYGVSLDDLRQFRQWGAKTPGHPEYGHTPGVETTTGPLGQGVGNAVGLALASRMMAARTPLAGTAAAGTAAAGTAGTAGTAGEALIDYRVFALCSDGDLMEGVASEAASLAGHLGLDNLVLVWDDNRITIDGTTELAFTEDVAARFAAYGFEVWKVDGHDAAAFRAALDEAVATTATSGPPARGAGKPKLIVARTHIGYGAPTKQDSPKAHGAPLGKAEAEGAKVAAGWPLEPFHVPAEAYAPFRARAAENQAVHAAWRARVAGAPAEARAALERHQRHAAPADLLAALTAAAPPAKDATRSLAAKIQQAVGAAVPALVGGSADLAESCKTTLKGGGDVAAGKYAGRNLHFGIREHGMGAILNGLALSGFFVPYGSTFLVFSDYMRPSIRLAALMGLQVVYVFTHDSVFLGEDGPTHQPVEHVASLRLIPNLDVVRPADAVECAAAWAHALARTGGPTALVLSRQNLPVLERAAGADAAAAMGGAVVLSSAEEPELVLIGSGSEVHVAVEVGARLTAQGKRVRVVSAPCWQAFERQPAAARAQLLGTTGRRVVIEAGVSAGWRHVVGEGGLVVGVDRFGASAPAERLAVEFGLTADAVMARLA